MKRIFMLLGIVFSINTVFSQSINKAEYFIDSDPGPGNGTTIPGIAQGDVVNFSFNLPTAGLNSGFHFLSTRVADMNGVWSRYETRVFYLSTGTTNTTNITGAEYFIDSDPGPGNGISVNTGSSGSIVNLPVAIAAPLSSGFHTLSIRVKDEEGKWSLFEQRGFYIASSPVDAPPVTAAEYFFDADPGIGNAASLPITTPGDIITQTFLIPVPAGLSQGDHILFIRVKDQEGHWSSFAKDTITVSNSATLSCPSNSVVTTSAGQCTAVVNGIDPTIAPAGSSYTYILAGATTGSGTGTASGTTFNKGITTVTYALTNSPSTSCSFTVTVNSALMPSVQIVASSDTTCPGSSLTFIATPTNGGANPSYQWKKNGIDFGSGTEILQSNVWANGDVVTVVMTSSNSCASPVSDTSNAITITVVPPYITPTINIVASATTICPGTAVTFFATQTNGGTPSYGWMVNGIWAGPDTDFSSFESSALKNGDKVKCALTSSLACVTDVTAVSNEVTITVLPVLPAQVSLTASADTICAGSEVTFKATPTNGGNPPFYEWTVNGNVVEFGYDDSTFESSTLQNGDQVRVTLSSTLWCTNPQVVTSNPITITTIPASPAFVSIAASATSICSGSMVAFNVTSVSSNATYQWKLNGNDIPGATGSTYQSSTLQNGDKIKVIMTPTNGCTIPPSAASNEITMTVNPSGPPSVSISASSTTICAGQLVTFTAAITNGGTHPVFEWTRNGSVVGSDTSVYQTTSLMNGDLIRLTMQPYGSCAGNAAVYSNSIPITVSASVTPSVTVSASSASICAGEPVTFSAAPISGAGSLPTFQWKRNGMNIPGATSSTYQSSSLQNGDVIKVAMTSSLSCANPQTVLSHDSITMVVSSVSLTPSVSISASATAICQGQTVLFTALPTNGGEVPGYQWKLNGINVGDNIDTFSSNSLQNGDKITVVMTTSVACAANPTATSAPIMMTVATPTTYYADFDGDGYGNGASGVAQACAAPPGYVSNNSDCNDENASIHPGATEICGNGIDDDCDGQTDEACGGGDNDGDGYTIAQGDCNDNNSSIHPGAAEICGNGIDDNCNGNIDENCNEALPVLMVKTNPIKEGDVGYTLLNIEVKLDHPTPDMVSVNYTTTDANATAGLDYVATNGILTIPAGSTSGTVQVRIIGDLLQENNESFWITFSDPINVALGKDHHSRIMIIDDDKGKPDNATARSQPFQVEGKTWKIPTVTKRNQVWMIPQIANFENEVLILNVQGQVVSRFTNYKNQSPIGNVAAGLYVYRIRITERSGQYKFYTGRLLITE